MLCKKCRKDYEGNFCPNCGTPAPGNAEKPAKKRGRFRWWYAVIIIVLIAAIGSAMGDEDSEGKDPDPDTSTVDQGKQGSDEQDSMNNSLPGDGENGASGEEDQAPSTPSNIGEDNAAQNNTTSDMTLAQQNALRSAENYLSVMAFSYSGLVDQLEYEGYTTEDAAFAADNCGADWNEQALKSANNYLSFSAFSYSGLIDQLEYEGFTTDQATYGADNCGADWNEQAAKCAQNYLDVMSFSREGLIDQLVYEGFTQAQAEYGVSAVGY